MRRFSRNIRTTKWTDVYETVFAPWLLPTILLAGIRKKGTFRITDKKTEQGKNSSVGYALPYLAGVLLCMIAIVRLTGLSAREQTLTYSVILFWLCLNLYFQLLACYVAVGRERKADYTMQALTMQGSLKGEKEICTVTCEGFPIRQSC